VVVMKLLRIVAPHFVAGIILGDIAIAPIIAFMRGWDETRVRDYCAKRGWFVEDLG
jgi:hypothetical protein